MFAKCLLRKKATRSIRRFFIDFRNFRLAYMMLRYRTNAIQLQKRVRSFIMVTNVSILIAIGWNKNIMNVCFVYFCVGQARVTVLTKLWIKNERIIRESLLPEVKTTHVDKAKNIFSDRKKEDWEVRCILLFLICRRSLSINCKGK